jgi:hypothetical protein
VTGPLVTFFGVARADDTLVDPIGMTANGVPIFSRPAGVGFSLVIEGRPGPGGATVGRFAFDTSVTSLPDLQIEVSRPLGNGSPDVCDMLAPTLGGVPATDPPNFDPTRTNINTVNDLACRFLDGGGSPLGRGASDSCVIFASGDFRFVNKDSTSQFCGFMDRPLQFPVGDTLVTARLRDVLGNVGAQAQVIIRAGL